MLNNLFNKNNKNTSPEKSEEVKVTEGVLDSISGTIIKGWAWNMKTPKRRVNVEILANDKVIGLGKAELFRQDLLQAKKGDGCYGFEIDVASMVDILPPEVTVSARIVDGHSLLGEIPHSFNFKELKVNQKAIDGKREGLSINFEDFGISGDKLKVSGWAFADNEIENIEVYFFDKKIGEARYGLKRTDVYDVFFDDKTLSSGFYFEHCLIFPSTSI